ncbi:hypothetical protein [Roseateles sp.]|uniref:hypothetical protein n=1 Tax=Roseateles sp. TaxID=1971397 RepID=UPI002E07F52B|nr:hypothetical protein [Roseateles sp.]
MVPLRVPARGHPPNPRASDGQRPAKPAQHQQAARAHRSPDGSSATAATATTGPAALAYTLTPQDSSGTALGTAQTGRVLLNPNHPSQPVQLQQQARTLNTDSDFVVSTNQTYNAFGELSESFDERVAERAAAVLGRPLAADELAVERTRYFYNTLGKPPMATSNSPTCGHPNSSGQDERIMGCGRR